ncbi:hypothetical protein GF356_12315 [candidate division GN15 bacterium]|nr:hypothetical protein [candidate division GN15 bacterium]
MSDPKLHLPDQPWRTATCCVCGRSFDYLTSRRPATCRDGECRYKYHYRIAPKTWANYQPSLFDPPSGR